MQKNKIVWIAIAAVVIVVGVYLVWSKNLIPGLKNQNSVQNKNQNTAIETDYQSKIPGGSGPSAPSDGVDGSKDNGDLTQGVDEESPEEKRSDEKPDENLRQQIITYVNQNLNKIVSPPAEDKWDVPTFYFIGNSNFYLELYAMDTDLAGYKLLYKVNKDNGGISLNELAKYKESEDDWVLAQGQDNFDNYVMEEYDYNEKNKKWEKTDEFTDETYSDDSIGEDLESGSNGSPASQGQIVR